MRARAATDAEVEMWAGRDALVDGDHQVPIVGKRVVVGGPEEGEGIVPCPALVAPAHHQGWPWVTHVAFELHEIEVAHLAQGGTLWLSTWGSFPVHLVEVVAP